MSIFINRGTIWENLNYQPYTWISLEEKSKPKIALVTYRILYDQTVEGIDSLDHPAYSMQYHPETAQDSRDASYLFGRFLEKMKS